MDISGNEKADTAAHLAADRNEVCPGIPIRFQDVMAEAKRIFQMRWQYNWNLTETAYKIVHPSVDTWKTPIKLTRRDQTVLTRIRMAHTNLTSMYLLTGERPARCPNCRVRVTIQHILVSCPIYDQDQ